MPARRARPAIAVVVAVTLLLAGCAVNEQGDAVSDLSGTLDGAGSSAQGAAQDAWIAGFQRANGSVTVNYDPSGSGAGREQFIVGAVGYAGSDTALTIAETAGELEKCRPGSGAVDLPVYLSPIVLAFNVEGVDRLQLDAASVAGIFSGAIERWNDPELVRLNPDVPLPDARITAVHRSDDSGTTENFTDYLAEAAPEAWPHEADDAFPYEGEAAQGNSGISGVLRDGVNVIGYLDASRAEGLDVASLRVGDEFVAPDAASAAAVVDVSPIEPGRDEGDLVIDVDRATGEPGVYPLVLVSYVIACREYRDENEGELVRGFLEWVSSEEGQDAAAEDAGSAPISPALRDRVQAVVADIR
ncbi:phosphate ABC transporter substrate-binding protein PstS [Agromyces sp. Marseille-P2726]|uniref:phosphate ABC transporter substrate-binding protein PstS n=1 Tax=Agromyces sp. Marseille-P2726 TaxID=2709132 RepID=UPI00156D6747|nr:phosphate ABC transporter substrate-binding protein PstS [Agromyces sp. Marseille-P2726]